MTQTIKLELSLAEIDLLEFTLSKYIRDRQNRKVWDNTLLEALDRKLLNAGDDIYEAESSEPSEQSGSKTSTP